MCGIAGILEITGTRSRLELEELAGTMADQLHHRGPDQSGIWVDEIAGIALAHRRLAIVDLTTEGAQPMRSKSGRFVVTFNGEIYNHSGLRSELLGLGHSFRGRSDTEVLLAAIDQWGPEGALERFNGMFAFALWDVKEHTLYLARDRMGEKPLYYGWMGQAFLFGSELKAVRAHPDGARQEIDRNALALYMRHGCIPAPYSIYAGFHKLIPAGFVTLRANRPSEFTVSQYWSLQAAARRGQEAPFAGSTEEAVERLDAALRDAVKTRMMADVPLGAFLSGGIDSSTIVALMQAQSPRPVKTFTIGYQEEQYNESQYAREIARHLGTDHRELEVTSGDALEVIPKLPDIYDEPFADSSQIPTFLVSRLARQHVTVSLSGDGGDEIFAGYSRYAFERIWRWIRRVPGPARKLAALLLRMIPKRALVESGLPRIVGAWLPPARIDNVTAALILPTPEATYRHRVSTWKEPTQLVRGAKEPPTLLSSKSACPELPSFVERMMYFDAVTYLPDDILVKVDRASMAVSLECRAPFLDHRIVELAWKLPLALKLRREVGKWILRQVLFRYLPAPLVERPKMGFAVPIGSWLQGPLREWAEDLLSYDRLASDGFLDPAMVRVVLSEHLSGEVDRAGQLWGVLMFQAWLHAHNPCKPMWHRAPESVA